MSGLRLRVLGGFEAQLLSGESVNIPIRKGQALLAYLALHPGTAMPRSKLAALLWGDHGDSQAQISLRQTLTVLRKALAPIQDDVLQADRRSIGLNQDCLEVDAALFQDLAGNGNPADLEEAVALYRGELLEGIGVSDEGFESWLEDERRRYRDLMIRALGTLVEAKRAEAALEDAVVVAHHLLTMDPLQESVHRVLMELYWELGQRDAALQQFRSCRKILHEELDIEPEPETETLYTTIRDNGFTRDKRTNLEHGAPAKTRPGEPTIQGPTEVTDPSPRAFLRSWQWPIAGAFAATLLVVGTGLFWLKPWVPDLEPASIERMAYPLPEKPSIAVLPFDNLSDDPEQEYFADGITDDLITALSKIPGIFVIARNSTFIYKGQAVEIRQVAEDLGVRYVLEGSIRRSNGRVRINAQLIDATTGGHVWVERYDTPEADIFSIQDQVTQEVALALAGKMTVDELMRQAGRETHSTVAYDSFLRAIQHMGSYTIEDIELAIGHLKRAIEIDPNFARAHAALALLYWDIGDMSRERHFGTTYDEVFKKAKYHLDEAMKVPSPLARFILSKIHSNEGRYAEAVAEAKRMIALNPNDPLGYQALARALNKTGRFAEGGEAIAMSMRLDPRGDPSGWKSYRLGESLYHTERFEEAVDAFKESVDRNQNEWSYFYLALAYAQAGQTIEAKDAITTFQTMIEDLGREPYTVARIEGWVFQHDSERERIMEGARKAGLPEGAAANVTLNIPQDVSPESVEGATTIDATMAKSLFDKGVSLIDVRDEEDWITDHIPNAVHLSLYRSFTEENLEAVAAKDHEVVILAHGNAASSRSARAVARAVSWGFTKVYYFRDGYPGWKAAGYPIQASP